MDLKILGQVEDMNRFAKVVAALTELSGAIDKYAYGGKSLAPWWFYDENHGAGITAEVVAMALKVPLGDVIDAGEHLPDIDRGALFIGKPHADSMGRVGPEDWTETYVCVDAFGLPYVVKDLCLSFRTPAPHHNELLGLAIQLIEVMTENA